MNCSVRISVISGRVPPDEVIDAIRCFAVMMLAPDRLGDGRLSFSCAGWSASAEMAVTRRGTAASIGCDLALAFSGCPEATVVRIAAERYGRNGAVGIAEGAADGGN